MTDIGDGAGELAGRSDSARPDQDSASISVQSFTPPPAGSIPDLAGASALAQAVDEDID